MKLLLLFAALLPLASASHSRGFYSTWTKTSVPLQINLTLVSAWRHSSWVDKLNVNMGDGQAQAFPTINSVVQTDSLGKSYVTLTDRGVHTYTSVKAWPIIYSSCCRISGLTNTDGSSPMKFMDVVNLLDSINPGSVQVSMPLIMQLGAGTITVVPIPVSLLEDDLTSTNSSTIILSVPTASESGITNEAPFTLDSAAKAISFDAANYAIGDQFAVQIQAKHGGDVTTIDWLIQLVDTQDLPRCSTPGGNIETAAGNTATGIYKFEHPGGALLKTISFSKVEMPANVAWDAKFVDTGSTWTLSDVASGTEIQFTWTPDSSQAGSTFSVTFSAFGGTSTGTCSAVFSVLENVDCASSYGAFDVCSKQCDGGFQTATLSITSQPVGTGAPCPAATKTQSCKTEACPATCVLTEAVQSPFNCATCAPNPTVDNECGSCPAKHGIDPITGFCVPLPCVGVIDRKTGDNSTKGYNNVVSDDGSVHSWCRDCEHGKWKSLTTGACDCLGLDTRPLAQPDAPELLIEETLPTPEVYTTLDKGIVNIVFTESTAFIRGKSLANGNLFLASDEFHITGDDGADASDACKVHFTWDTIGFAGNGTDSCPLRRTWRGQVQLTDLMGGDCNVTPPAGGGDSVTVTVRFGVTGKRWIRMFDGEFDTSRYQYSFQTTSLPILFEFPLKVTVESTPAKIYDAISRTVGRIVFYVKGCSGDVPDWEALCDSYKAAAVSHFGAPGNSSTCNYLNPNPANASGLIDTTSGRVTIELYANQGQEIEVDLFGGGPKATPPRPRCQPFKDDLGTHVTGSCEVDEEPDLSGGGDGWECGSKSEAIALRAITNSEIIPSTGGSLVMAKVTLEMTISAPFRLTTPIAPQQDTRFLYFWGDTQRECPLTGECAHDFTLFMADHQDVCSFTGAYQISLSMQCRAANIDVPGFQCPVQPNYFGGGFPVTTVDFTLSTGDHCPKLGGKVVLDAAMFTYKTDPEDDVGKLVKIVGDKKPATGTAEVFDENPAVDGTFNAFLNNQIMYFRAQVRSDEAGLATAFFESIVVVPVVNGVTSDNAADLVQLLGVDGITAAGTQVGLKVFDAATTRAGGTDPAVRVNSATTFLLPRFEFKADTDAEFEDQKRTRRVLATPRDSSASFILRGIISVTYTAGDIGAPGRRRLLHFNARQLAEAGSAEEVVNPETQVEFDPRNEYDPNADNTEESGPSSQAPGYSAAPRAEVGFSVAAAFLLALLW